MVCIKDLDIEHDFDNDEIKLIIFDNHITANKTTLGVDNGVAIAIMLTVLGSDFSHPTLECLFTTDEEEGMSGIKNFDIGRLKGKYYINLDNEVENELIIGSAGGVTGIIYQLNNRYIKNNLPAYQIEISNLHGGHSGVEIDKGYWNSNLLMAKLLENISKYNEIFISEFIGGEKDNAISNRTRCVIHTNNKNMEKQLINNFHKFLFVDKDKNCQLNIKMVNNSKSFNNEDTVNILKLLTGLKQNVIYEFTDGIPSTSANIGMVNISKKKNELHILIRSANEIELKKIMDINKAFSIECNYNCIYKDPYPLWEKSNDSVLLKKYKQIYKSKTGKNIKENVIHAGLECCVIKERMPNMEIISIGPNIKNAHTTEEKVEIFSIKNILQVLIELLEEW